MMKCALFVATVGRFLGFERNDIAILQSMGYEVHCAANFSLSEWDDFNADGIIRHQIDFARIPWSGTNLAAYREMKELLSEVRFDLVHCHTPMGGVVARIAARRYRKAGMKVIYTAHGFHFFKGAPLKNWLLYFPVEWVLAHWTDVLITINKEDYRLAQKWMKAKKIEYIPGVGVDTNKFSRCVVNKAEKCKELNIPADKFVLLSVGELHSRKNQKVVIDAIHRLNDKDIYYLIAGKGKLEEEYRSLIREYSLEENIRLLGFREDIDELCKIADCFVHPSVREGLGIAPLEAMACGLPLIISDVNGIKDYAVNGVSGYCVNPTSVTEMSNASNSMKQDKEFRLRCGKNNIDTVKQFDISKSNEIMERIYVGGVTDLEKLLIRKMIRNQLGISDNDFVIISVGEVNDNKNHQVIIEAVDRLHIESIKYLICGRGDKEDYLHKLIIQKGLTKQVLMLGYQKNVRDYLYASDIFAFPSKREGLGLAAIEAMAAGLPIVTSASGGINDFSVNGITGFKCRYGDVASFERAINTLYWDKEMCSRMGKGNVARSKSYDRKIIIEEMTRIYKGIH